MNPGRRALGVGACAALAAGAVALRLLVARTPGDGWAIGWPDEPIAGFRIGAVTAAAAAGTALGVSGVNPGAVRRNVVVEGIDLPALIGARFSLGGVTFEGTAESTPCYWMDQAVGPGAEAWLKGRGGLRARILTDGDLAVGPSAFTLEGGQLTLDAVLPAQAAR
jgi:hypothetical protein